LIKNIIFDWSGVLSNDFTLVYNGVMYIFRKLGLRTLSVEEFKKEFSLPYMGFYEKFTTAPKEEIDRLFLQAIHLLEGPKPFPGAKELLEFLSGKQIRLAILSSNPQEKLEEEVKDYGFQEFFINIKGSVHDKTEEISKLMERNGFLAQETAYVGDMIHDIEAGKKAKVTTIAISWGGYQTYQTKEELRAEKPDFLIDDLSKIKKIVSCATQKGSLFYFCQKLPKLTKRN